MKVLALFSVLLFVISCALLILAKAESRPQPAPMTKWEGRILALERDAIEHAFHEQIQHLFTTWMKDDTGQPNRAVTGVLQARKAFIGSMEALDRREREYKATLPSP
jgi:hypothetical protein